MVAARYLLMHLPRPGYGSRSHPRHQDLSTEHRHGTASVTRVHRGRSPHAVLVQLQIAEAPAGRTSRKAPFARTLMPLSRVSGHTLRVAKEPGIGVVKFWSDKGSGAVSSDLLPPGRDAWSCGQNRGRGLHGARSWPGR
jgi:hypothetical protein